MSNSNQGYQLYFSISLKIPQLIPTSTKLHHPIFNPCFPYCNSHSYLSQIQFLGSHSFTIPGALLMPSWRHYVRALYVFQMSWHCAPLKYEGAISLSGKPMRGKPQSVSNQKGSSSCLQSENCWSQSPICWPMVTVSNLSTRTNNCWLAYQPVTITRWYIISVSCNDHNIYQSQPYSRPQCSYQCNALLQFPINTSSSIFNVFPNNSFHNL